MNSPDRPEVKLAQARPRAPARWGAGRGVRGRGDPGAKRGFWSSLRPLRLGSVGFPVARIEEVVADGAEAELRDERHDALVVVASNELADARDQLSVETVFDELRGPETPIDHVIEDEVRVGVGEAELALVGLPLPELRRRRLVHDRFGNADRERELAELRLVQIAHWIDAAGHVAELRSVAKEELGLVAGPEDDPVRPGAVVFDALPLARPLVAEADLVDLRVDAGEVRVHLPGDRHLLEREAELFRELLSVVSGLSGGRV